MKQTTELTSCVFLIYPRNIGNTARNLGIYKVVAMDFIAIGLWVL
jgi:hypothetical protein